jgi:hypothetical protein
VYLSFHILTNIFPFQTVSLRDEQPPDAAPRHHSGVYRGPGGPALVKHKDLQDARRVLRRQRRREGVYEDVEPARAALHVS